MLQNFFLEEEEYKSPEVKFQTNGVLTIKGISTHDNFQAFFEPALIWLKEYCLRPAEVTEFSVRLKYYNTGTAKGLFQIVQKLSELKKNGHIVIIQWYIQDGDEDMTDNIQTFSELSELPISVYSY